MPKTLSILILVIFLILAPARSAPGQAQQVLIPPISRPEPDQPDLSPAFTGCGGLIAPLENDAYEQQVVELVNAARDEHGLPPLKRSDSFGQAARYHAADLGQDNYFDHSTYDREGSRMVYVCSAWERIEAYTSGAHAENIAAGFTTPQEVMAGWMESAGHRGNILNPSI